MTVPYNNERAARLGHSSIANSHQVQDALSRWTYPDADPDAAAALTAGAVHPLSALSASPRPAPTGVIAFDGSPQEVAARVEYPSVKVGYVQVGAVYLKIQDFLDTRGSDGLIDLTALERTRHSNVVNTVLPSTHIATATRSGVQTWRDELFNTFLSQQVHDFGQPFSMVDALMTIHGGPGAPATSLTLHKCPDCGAAGPSVGGTATPCHDCGQPLYPTDVLRTHEEYADEGSNMTLFTRVMNVLERLLVIAYMDGFYRHNDPTLLGKVAFVTDGPLALYGPTAPIRSRILDYWQALVLDLQVHNRVLPIWVGVEKSGAFVDHAHQIKEGIPLGSVLSLSNDYIKAHVVPSTSAEVYGKDEFYGRRFIYRTTTGAALVVSVPRTSPGRPYEVTNPGQQLNCEALASYATLKPTLEMLDRLQTRMYENAVVPLVLAHNAAALPLGTGRSVLTLIAQQHLGMTPSMVTAHRGNTGTYF